MLNVIFRYLLTDIGIEIGRRFACEFFGTMEHTLVINGHFLLARSSPSMAALGKLTTA